MTDGERSAAIAGINPFLDDRKRHKRGHTVSGWKYLNEKRWELLARPGGTSGPSGVYKGQAWNGHPVGEHLRSLDPVSFDAVPGRASLIEEMDTDVYFEARHAIYALIERKGWIPRIARAFGKNVHVRLQVSPPAEWVGN